MTARQVGPERTGAELTIHGLRARPVDIPMRRPLQTGAGTVRTAPLVLVDLQTTEGVIGCSYVFVYTSLALGPVVQLLTSLGEAIAGQAVAPLDIEAQLQRRFRLLGPQGLTGMAMAAIDMAAWDALARAAQLPLVRLLGGAPRPIQAYDSRGVGLVGPERAAEEAAAMAAEGFRALKVRLGYPDARADLSVVQAVRRAVGDEVQLMVDYNQCLTVPEAVARARALAGEGLAWIEEPTRADDYVGHACIRQAAVTPIQLGENWWGPHDMAKSIAAGASDYVMPDVMKIGGVSGWLRAAAQADAAGLPLSCHLFPELCAHLLAVTPTAHWLEYVDWAAPILTAPPIVVNGQLSPSPRSGSDVAWDEDAVRHYLVA
jgi:mandelate racemase